MVAGCHVTGVLGLRAAKVLTRRLREGALSDGRRLQQLLTGEVQADFVVICGDGDERQAATGAIEATLFDENAKQRFVNAFAALSGSSVEPNSVQCAMVDRRARHSSVDLGLLNGVARTVHMYLCHASRLKP
eukprot:g16300.t1